MRIALLLSLALVTLTACRGEEEPIDADLDGSPEAEDCDDSDATAFPGAVEVCDGVDNDCDGGVDNEAADMATVWLDADGDGHGNPALPDTACEVAAGYVDNDADCDDSRADIHPGATEADCTDPTDYNCDGSTGYADEDSDGVPACEDCDDTDPKVNPQGVELCDGIDNDCDEGIDDDAVDALTFYADTDADGFGDVNAPARACEQPTAHVTDATDCDDAASTVFPGAAEVCNDVDEDCDGDVDESASDAPSWYADADGDGSGNSQVSLTNCDQPNGFVSFGGDCNDLEASDYPGATEVCDGADNDCDGETDESGAQGESVWYADSDGDSFGNSESTTSACDVPTGYVSNDTDCDDTASSVYPNAPERCNDVDDDCDESLDEDAVDKSTFYSDGDGDGFGRAGSEVQACKAPTKHVTNDGDCDDARAAVNPDATEVADNSLDDNCDGNQPPEPAPHVKISPTTPAASSDLVCKLADDNPTTDPDGDDLTYLFTWKVDGEAWEGITETTTYQGDTIVGLDTALDEVWTCEVTATDGTELGTPAAAEVTITDWLNLADGSSCPIFQNSGVSQVYCGQVTSSYAECQALCDSIDPASRLHWENNNGDYAAWGNVISLSFELCDGDTTCEDGDDDNFWSAYSSSRAQTFCNNSGGNRMTCGGSWWTNGTQPTRCFCYR